MSRLEVQCMFQGVSVLTLGQSRRGMWFEEVRGAGFALATFFFDKGGVLDNQVPE